MTKAPVLSQIMWGRFGCLILRQTLCTYARFYALLPSMKPSGWIHMGLISIVFVMGNVSFASVYFTPKQ